MVCPYCSAPTRVTNSCKQKRANSVWRRRECSDCGAIFSSIESIDYATTLLVVHQSHTEAFSRDKLLLSVYESLRHRKTAIADASALTTTIIGNLLSHPVTAQISAADIVLDTVKILARFDKAAATHYQAFHNPG
jgi:transcriptional repressor NrdR